MQGGLHKLRVRQHSLMDRNVHDLPIPSSVKRGKGSFQPRCPEAAAGEHLMHQYHVLFSGSGGETIMSSRYIITFFPSKSPDRVVHQPVEGG